MPTVLIVSPNFPPVNAADMQRVRMSLPHFEAFGWRPVVLAAAPEYVERVREGLLLETVPDGVAVCRTRALPARLTRRVGVGDLGLRALPFFYRAGLHLIRQYEVDLVYFSTTAFPILTLGRIWKGREGVPFVVDMQDPWWSDYERPAAERNVKYRLARLMHRVLEPWTMKAVDGVIAVSEAYVDTLHRRYPWLQEKPAPVLPFGASEMDLALLRAAPRENGFFRAGNGHVHGVYAGRGGSDMAYALRVIFTALRRGLDEAPELFGRLRLHFVGTSYAADERARKTVAPVAEAVGVAEYVREHVRRIPYFDAMQLLLDADFLLLPGSDDAGYTASKIYPYIMARRPLLGVFHEASSVVDIVRRTRSGTVIPFRPDEPIAEKAGELFLCWRQMLAKLPYEPDTDWKAFAPYTAREMTRRQCELFDRVLEERAATF